MVYGGVRDVLVTNEIVGRQKLRRLMALAHTAAVGVCVDDPAQIADLDAAAAEAGVANFPVHVEINMGGNRCGVEPGEPALDLARRIGDSRHLRFAGLQAYHGSAQHLRGWDERQKAIAGAVEKAAMTRDLLSANGIACDNITGAGTGTFEFEAGSGVYTELQCGSYVFMDADYGRNLDRDGRPTDAFEHSLFVWATVMSRPNDERAIVDAGLKALAFNSGPPTVWDEPAATYERASDEHGRLGDRRRDEPAEARRQGAPRAGPLRPDRQPLRLVCRHPRRPGRKRVADHRARGGVLNATVKAERRDRHQALARQSIACRATENEECFSTAGRACCGSRSSVRSPIAR